MTDFEKWIKSNIQEDVKVKTYFSEWERGSSVYMDVIDADDLKSFIKGKALVDKSDLKWLFNSLNREFYYNDQGDCRTHSADWDKLKKLREKYE